MKAITFLKEGVIGFQPQIAEWVRERMCAKYGEAKYSVDLGEGLWDFRLFNSEPITVTLGDWIPTGNTVCGCGHSFPEEKYTPTKTFTVTLAELREDTQLEGVI